MTPVVRLFIVAEQTFAHFERRELELFPDCAVGELALITAADVLNRHSLEIHSLDCVGQVKSQSITSTAA